MKRICILLLAALALLMTACGNTGDAEIIYGDSDIYSQSDMDSAIRLIKREFSGWSGCELHKIEYAGWQWHLARADDGRWYLLTWGY